jgi:hypothetical protein
MAENRDMRDKPTKWPTEIVGCGTIDCAETCWLVEDQGNGYCSYECPVHGAVGVQWEEDWEYNDDDGLMLDPYYDDSDYDDDSLDWGDALNDPEYAMHEDDDDA